MTTILRLMLDRLNEVRDGSASSNAIAFSRPALFERLEDRCVMAADTLVWTGSENGDLADAANWDWDNGQVPDSSDTLQFGSDGAAIATVSGVIEIDDAQIISGTHTIKATTTTGQVRSDELSIQSGAQLKLIGLNDDYIWSSNTISVGTGPEGARSGSLLEIGDDAAVKTIDANINEGSRLEAAGTFAAKQINVGNGSAPADPNAAFNIKGDSHERAALIADAVQVGNSSAGSLLIEYANAQIKDLDVASMNHAASGAASIIHSSVRLDRLVVGGIYDYGADGSVQISNSSIGLRGAMPFTGSSFVSVASQNGSILEISSSELVQVPLGPGAASFTSVAVGTSASVERGIADSRLVPNIGTLVIDASNVALGKAISEIAYNLAIGDTGTGVVTIKNGSEVTGGIVYVGRGSLSPVNSNDPQFYGSGILTIDGSGAGLTRLTVDSLSIFDLGTLELKGGLVTAAELTLGTRTTLNVDPSMQAKVVGNGTLIGLVNVDSGSIDAGDSGQRGRIRIEGELNLMAAGSLNFDINADGTADELTLAKSGAKAGSLAICGGDINIAQIGDGAFKAGQKFALIKADGGIQGVMNNHPLDALLDGGANGLPALQAGLKWKFSIVQENSKSVLQLSVVPEPKMGFQGFDHFNHTVSYNVEIPDHEGPLTLDYVIWGGTAQLDGFRVDGFDGDEFLHGSVVLRGRSEDECDPTPDRGLR